MDDRVLILGGGPAGVGAAFALGKRRKAAATLFERGEEVGGNAGSFWSGAQWLDYGSHRLHHSCDPGILDDLRGLLGDDLAERPRQGRIRLRGRWIRFPLSGPDLLLRLDKAFAFGAGLDMVTRALPRGAASEDSFATVLQASLGPTICEHFYFPYARKIWGHPPEALSAIQAKRRVSASSFTKLLKKVVKPTGGGKFYYPKEGFGQITRALAQAAAEGGAEVRTRTEVTRVSRTGAGWRVEANSPSGPVTVDGRHLWSTLPLTVLAQVMDPAPEPAVHHAVGAIDYRAMVLAYLEVETDRLHETDAHYFPEEDVLPTRISEPKNYFGHAAPRGLTTLCAEIPCAFDDEVWRASDESLGERVAEDLDRVGLPLPAKPRRVFTRRLRHAYPIYLSGYEQPLEVLDRWASGLPDFVSFGRQGLFAHDNTHHALAMAYAAVECLRPEGFDTDRWASYREVFATHVVED